METSTILMHVGAFFAGVGVALTGLALLLALFAFLGGFRR